MAKLYFTQVPTLEDIRQHLASEYPSADHLTVYSHVLLRKVTVELETHLDIFFSNYNLSVGRFTLMTLLLYTDAGLMPSELAVRVGVTQATISGLINSLEKANLVKRTMHEKDGRSFVINLTEAGFSKCHEIFPLYHERVSLYWKEFTAAEKTALHTAFEKIIKNLHRLSEG